MNNFSIKRSKTERVKTAKNRKISSTRWLQRQLNDPFVISAKENGFRCRAAFKILEINDKFKIFKKGQKVLDLGSAPGGWSQVIVEKVGINNIVAVDILDMNFLADDAKVTIMENSGISKFDVVMSDMAANTTGDKKTDHIRTLNLVEQALDFSITILKHNGTFISKIFQGGAEKELLDKLKKNFSTVKHFKPKSSRQSSVEMYLVAIGFKGGL